MKLDLKFYYENKYVKYTLCVLLAIITMLAFKVRYIVADWDSASELIGSQYFIWVSYAKLKQNFVGFSFIEVVCGCALISLYIKGFPFYKKIKLLEILVALFFGILNTCGLSLYYSGNLNFITSNTYQLVISTICIAGYSILFLNIYMHFSNFVESKWLISSPKILNRVNGNLVLKYYDKHPFKITFSLLLLCWLPWIVSFYPGCVNWDTYGQLNTAFGYDHRNAHPIVLSWIMGVFVRLGRVVSNDNLGFFLFIIFQVIICGCSYAYVVKTIKGFGIRRSVQWIIIAYFGIVPIWGAYAVMGHKDTLFAALLAVFVARTAQIIKGQKILTKPIDYISYIIIIFSVCLIRHNGTYTIFPTLIAIYILLGKRVERKRIGAIIIMTFMIIYGFNNVMLPLFGYDMLGNKETMSIMFQQTARYCKYYDKDVTKEEKDTINSILDYNVIRNNYVPDLSDAVKRTYKITDSKDEKKILKKYIQIWWEMFKRKPQVYIEATIANTYGYYSFTPKYFERRDMGNIGMVYRLDIEQQAKTNLGIFDFKFSDNFKELRNILTTVADGWGNVPIINILYVCAFYTWTIISIAVFWLCKKQWNKMILALPAIITIAICDMSPVNDCFRYFLPVAAMLPVIFCCLNLDCKNVCSKECVKRGENESFSNNSGI